MTITLLYTTAPSPEIARDLARRLIEARAAACVNIVQNMISVYRWEGAIEETPECALFIKTTAEKAETAQALIATHHPYENPACIVIPITGGLPKFLTWIAEETRP
jgi:periplasmic divalent cation tolerance protein